VAGWGLNLASMVKFYSKLTPKTALYVFDGRMSVKFDTIDGLIGFFATDDEKLQAEFALAMRQNRGGVSEIDEATFHAQFVEPKKNGLTAVEPWREELSKSSATGARDPLSVFKSSYAQAVVGVKSAKETPLRPIGPPKPVAVVVAEPESGKLPKTVPQDKVEFNPRLGKRVRPPNKE
jgi:hypothetical protein